ncbi:putative uncharacterized protein DDB_G0287457 [Achroia grisella]|uniref:putative uncharacterized protein DDB_G0287457 n=1 Tax=Achroia grisella TaxID=688607 RepID=UPI0027D2B378|nr:putative uncharacterized protein DDB_G0287457 [Achroia grisella]
MKRIIQSGGKIPDFEQDISDEAADILNLEDNEPQLNSGSEESLKEPEYDDDYQIEDNRLEVKDPSNEEPNLNIDNKLLEDLLKTNENVDEAQQDYDVFQQILGDNDNDIEEKLLYVDESSTENKNDDNDNLAQSDLLDEHNDQQDNSNERNSNSEEISIAENENNDEISNVADENPTNNFSNENNSQNFNSLSSIDEVVDNSLEMLQKFDNQSDSSKTGSNKILNKKGINKPDDPSISEDDSNGQTLVDSIENNNNEFHDINISSFVDSQSNLNDIIDETRRKLLKESGEQFENQDINDDRNIKEQLKNKSENVLIPEENKSSSFEENLFQIINSQVNVDDVVNENKILEKSDKRENNELINEKDALEQLKSNSEVTSIPEEKNNAVISKLSDEDYLNGLTEEKLLEIVNSQLNVAEIVNETHKILEDSDNRYENHEPISDSEKLEQSNNEEISKLVDENVNAESINGIPESMKQSGMKDIINETNKPSVDTGDNINNIDSQERHIQEIDDNFNFKDGDALNVNPKQAYSEEDKFDEEYISDYWNKIGYKENILQDFETILSSNENVLDYEEKYGKPFGEGKVLSQRDYYYDYINEDKADDPKDFDNDKAIEEILNRDVIDDLTNVLDEPELKMAYVNDALPAVDKADVEESKSTEKEIQIEDKEPTKTMNVEKLSSSELDELTNQFKILHSEDFNMKSDRIENGAPIHIKLSLDEPTEVTSPNYPEPYPTNNVVEWLFDGEGVGIELNITDFNLTSVLGHYMIVKPGSSDGTGDDGLIFAYHLNKERRYRFMDVDKLYIKFESLFGNNTRRGFRLSLKMIAPPEEDPDELPNPEPLLPTPNSTMSLYLAGRNLTGFEYIREEFRLLLADMATHYIVDNDIDRGLNSTTFVTQITHSYICNIQWPGYENCVQVEYAVPLVYEDEREHRLNATDLSDMWLTYSTKDPFHTRLQSLGLSEFTTPNDGTVLLMWLVFSGTILITVMMLAFALWKFSCFDSYTRMQTFSDTDSLHNEKRNLDMYPTPHQTLPPLFSESNYKWHDNNYEDTARVDMGGFTNANYVRDDLSESDEEIVVSRETLQDKNHNSSAPKDMTNV